MKVRIINHGGYGPLSSHLPAEVEANRVSETCVTVLGSELKLIPHAIDCFDDNHEYAFLRNDFELL